MKKRIKYVILKKQNNGIKNGAPRHFLLKGILMSILYRDKNIVVVYKPAGIPSQSDLSGDEDIMKITAKELSETGEKDNLWLVHRLDRTVGGLMVFARNKNSAASLSAIVGSKDFEKEYLAVLDGKAEGGFLSDYVYKDSKKGKAFVAKGERRGVKLAELEYCAISSIETPHGTKTLVRVKLYTGRFHQIRVQFSSRGIPLCGDGKYGSRDNKAKMPSLFAFRLSFDMNGKRIENKKLPDLHEYPWSLFGIEELENL